MLLPNKAILSEAFAWGPTYINVYGHGWSNVASDASGGLEALALVQGLGKAPLYRSLVARELGEGVCLVRVPDEGSAEQGDFCVLLGLHLLCLGESFGVLLFIPYAGRCGRWSVLILN